ncbi:MAG: class I SAM-dependent methyltransferase [Thaumarchaeota archaeon]|nr:class I SAM-dependent methyltransferase [Nitrososphaerota archaeon]
MADSQPMKQTRRSIMMLPEPRIVEELSWTERGLPQKERTRNVHGLHPYLGKYVPQLVDYFLDRYFRGSKYAVVDPFVGSGTTLVETNIFGVESLGVDVSEFNALLSRVKIAKYDLHILTKEVSSIVERTKREFYSASKGELDSYISEEVVSNEPLDHVNSDYLRKWYSPEALYPLLIFCRLIKGYVYEEALKILLSRAARSARLATHYELDFPKEPQSTDYYCHKHDRICHPTSASLPFITRYAKDSVRRIGEFQKIRTDAEVRVECADAREFNFSKSDIGGVITSPPYVGLINYHEQHRYAFELLGLEDRSSQEIGPKYRGNGKSAIEEYKGNIAQVLKRIADCGIHEPNKIIIVVNDKFELYTDIALMAGLKLIERLRRKVDRRTGRRSNNFYEDIFVLTS